MHFSYNLRHKWCIDSGRGVGAWKQGLCLTIIQEGYSKIQLETLIQLPRYISKDMISGAVKIVFLT